MPDTVLSGWGRTAPSRADVVRVGSTDDVASALTSAGPRGVLARGLGRSYGDAAQNAGGTVLDLSVLDRIDVGADGIVRAGAGAVLADVIAALEPHGLFVPVSPGTSRVTLGGAVAADVHGKNHHRDGSFGDHVVELEVVVPDGSTRRLGPASQGDDLAHFRATIGGMGLTGVVTEVVLRAMPVPSQSVLVDTRRLGSLDAVMDRMASTDDQYRYSVAWIDATAAGSALGRGVVTQGDHAPAGASGDVAAPPRVALPVAPPVGVINRWTVRAFNEAWFRKAPSSRDAELQGVRQFFHPLDGVGAWNRAYGPRGLVQHQCAVPDSEAGVVEQLLRLFRDSGAPSFLSVLKRFGPGNGCPLSFPRAGWTLAVDLPGSTPDIARILDRADGRVLGAGGRTYLAKDSRVAPEALRAMYPRLPEWLEVRERVDPRRVLVSDLSRRLSL